MPRITHTNDSLNLIHFLTKYPDCWHSYAGDKRTFRAVWRVSEMCPGFEFRTDTRQMILVSGAPTITWKAV